MKQLKRIVLSLMGRRSHKATDGLNYAYFAASVAWSSTYVEAISAGDNSLNDPVVGLKCKRVFADALRLTNQ